MVKEQGVVQNHLMTYMYCNISVVRGSEVTINNKDLFFQGVTPSQVKDTQELARE